MRHYDYVVVGAGLFGSVFAAEVSRAGKSCLVVDRRDHVGGFCSSYKCPETGIEVHRHGPHIFHTNDWRTWEWMQRYTDFYPYRHRVLTVALDGRVYEMPINLDTFERLESRRITPAELEDSLGTMDLTNFETAAITRVGVQAYEMLIKGYTIKQWGCHPKELPSSIIRRLPVHTRYSSGYFQDRYQGVPADGYDAMFHRMLSGVDVELNWRVGSDELELLRKQCDTLVWTGPIDGFYDCDLGRLGWRSVSHTTEVLREDDHQGCAQMNYAGVALPWTRKIEPKHFRPDRWVRDRTVVQTEYAGDDPEDPAYPIRRKVDMKLLAEYRQRAEQERQVIFGGRLASYCYYDMHQVVAQAVTTARTSLSS